MANSSTHSFSQTKYLATISIMFYTIVLISCVVGQKLISFSGFVISAGTLIFPWTYMIVAAMTEVYGFERTRRVIITGAACNIFSATFIYFVSTLQPYPLWKHQDSFELISNITSQIIFTSTIAYLVSEYVNAKTLSWLNIIAKGRWLILRALASISVAIILDAILMLPIIVSNSPHSVTRIFISLISSKFVYELFLLPLLWVTVSILKSLEEIPTDSDNLPLSSVTYLKKIEQEQ